jgi:RHS repeat-associated protein
MSVLSCPSTRWNVRFVKIGTRAGFLIASLAILISLATGSALAQSPLGCTPDLGLPGPAGFPCEGDIIPTSTFPNYVLPPTATEWKVTWVLGSAASSCGCYDSSIPGAWTPPTGDPVCTSTYCAGWEFWWTSWGNTLPVFYWAPLANPCTEPGTHYICSAQYAPVRDGKNQGEPDNGPCFKSSDVFAGNPINVATGNKYETVVDLSVSTPGIPLEFRRSYNSLVINTSASGGLIGAGWTHNFNIALKEIRTAPYLRVQLEDSDGRTLYFSQTGETSGEILFSGEAGVKDRLRKTVSTGEYFLRRKKDDLTYKFGSDKRLVRISDQNENALDLAYTDGRLTQVSNNFGKTLSIQYDTSNRFYSITDPKGQSVSYGYLGSVLRSVAYPDGRSIGYDDWGDFRLKNKYDTEGNVIGHWDYDDWGRVRSHYRYLQDDVPQERLDFSYYDYSDTTTLTRSTGAATYATDVIGGVRVTREITGCSTSTCGSALHKVFVYTPELDLRDTTVISEGQSYTTRYTYDNPPNPEDRVGEITEVREALGRQGEERTTSFSYAHREDDPFLLTQMTETKPSVANPGHTMGTTTYYDNAGNVSSVVKSGYAVVSGVPTWKTYTTTYQHNGPGGQVSSIDGPRTDVSDTATYEYYPNTADQGNNRGQLKAVVNALNHRTELSNYDANGNVGAITDPNNIVTSLTYDARNRLLTATTQSLVTQYGYDDHGNLAFIIPPEGTRIDYTYTLSDKLSRVTDNLGNRIQCAYDVEGNRTAENIYDPSNALKKSLSFTYDAYNRLKRIVNPDSTYTEYTYDDKGNRTAVRDPRGNSTSSTYDALDRLIGVTPPLSALVDYTYDAHDNPTSVTDPNDLVTHYASDDFGNRYQTVSPDTGTMAYSYDEAGNVTQQVDAKGTVITYTYDALNRLTAIQFPLDSSQNIGYTYDATTVTYGKGTLTGRTDTSGQYTYHYDVQGNLAKEEKIVSGVTYTTQFAYNRNNALTSIIYPSGRVVTYARDSQTGRISGVSTTFNSMTTTLASSLTYRPFGGLTGLIYGNGLSLVHGYDTQYRSSDITVNPVINHTYGYDANGNVTSIADGTPPLPPALETPGVYTYEEGSNVLANIAGSSPIAFQADENGNTTHENSRIFSYDLLNRLTGVSDSTVQYVYNALNQRASKTAAGSTRIFHYDLSGHLIAETTSTGSTIAEYVYLGDELLAMIRSGAVYYYHNDHLGTPLVLTDASGNVAWKAEYTPFGKAEIAVNNVENPFRFPGQYYDSQTGLHYNYHRYYQPETGRYVTPDPIGLGGGVNLYGYVENDPVGSADPSGLYKSKDPWYGYNDPNFQDWAHGEKDSYNKGPGENYSKREVKDLWERWNKLEQPRGRGGKSCGGGKPRSGGGGRGGVKLGAAGAAIMGLDFAVASKEARENGIDVWTQMYINMGYAAVVIRRDGSRENFNGAKPEIY